MGIEEKALSHDLIMDLYGQVRHMAIENEQLRQENERLRSLLPEEGPDQN